PPLPPPPDGGHGPARPVGRLLNPRRPLEAAAPCGDSDHVRIPQDHATLTVGPGSAARIAGGGSQTENTTGAVRWTGRRDLLEGIGGCSWCEDRSINALRPRRSSNSRGARAQD